MLARIGVMKALNRHVERVFNPDRKETHWGKHKLKRTGCDLVHILGPKKNDSLDLIVQIKQRS
jgi:riboflavin synthase